MLNLNTKAVSKCHFCNCISQSVTVKSICGKNASLLHILVKFSVLVHNALIIRKLICILWRTKPYKPASCFFKLRSHNILKLSGVYCKGNQCRRNIDLIKGTGHTVLSSDRRKTESHLCRISAQKCCKRLAPALGIFCHTTEIFLEGKADLSVVTACSHDSCHGFCYCVSSSVIRAPGRKIWIKTIAHHGHSVCITLLNRNLCYHCLSFCQLIFAAVGHKYASRSDGTVKHFHKPLLGAYVKVRKSFQPFFFYVRYFLTVSKEASFFIWNFHFNCGFLMRSVCIKESTGNIYDFFVSPGKYKSRLFCNNSNRNCLQVFFICKSKELVYIFWINNNCHTLLRLGNSDLCSVKSRIFFRNLIKIDSETCCQLADGNRHSAGAKVITFLDNAAYFLSAEHTLDLTFCRSISFLYLSAAHFNRSLCMHLG